MPEYIVMFPADNEAEMDARSDAQRQVVFDVDYEFGQLLAALGGAVTGGAGLRRSKHARTIRRGSGSGAEVTEGPWVESVEQLSGFFIVTCEDYDSLVQAAEVLVRASPRRGGSSGCRVLTRRCGAYVAPRVRVWQRLAAERTSSKALGPPGILLSSSIAG